MPKWWELPEGWLSLLLILLLLLTVAGSLQNGRWVISLRLALSAMLPATALVGVLAGFVLARLRWLPRWLAHSLGLAGGLAWIIELSSGLQNVHITGSSQIVYYLHPNLDTWRDRAIELLIRVIILGRNFFQGEYGDDITLFIIVLALICWVVAFLSAWFAFRSHWPWMSIGLPGLVLLLNLVYGPDVSPRYFQYFALLSLIFLVYYLWKRQEQEWQRENVHYPREMSGRIFWVGVALSLVLVLGSALLPTSTGSAETASFWDRFLEPWREVRGTWERLFSEVGTIGEGRIGAYSSSFELAGGRVTPEGYAMLVLTDRNEYLRGIVFDQYDGRGWLNTAENGPSWTLPPGQILNPDVLKRVRVDHTIVPLLQGGNMIFAIAEPMSMTLPATVELGSPVEEAGFADIVSIRSRQALQENRPYKVSSWFTTVDKASLRRSELDYPDWVLRRYLALPQIPSRIRELADRIVATHMVDDPTDDLLWEQSLPDNSGLEELRIRRDSDEGPVVAVIQKRGQEILSVYPSGGLVQLGLVNPYDAAEAIQTYLRTELTYRESITAPPEGRDAVDYFLFDSQAGYCDYFGSAMTVLLRTQGIAARLVRGYASGEYDSELDAYIVPVAAAHTWTEVYFNNYGWQRFEPTPADYTSLPSRRERPPSSGDAPPRTPNIEMDDEPFDPEDRLEDIDIPLDGEIDIEEAEPILTRPGVIAPMTILLLVLVGLGVLLLWAGRGLRRLNPVAVVYERMCRWATLVGLGPQRQSTPYEYAWQLADALPEQRPAIALITTQYVKERFGQTHTSVKEIVQVQQAWQKLRWPLWGYVLQRLQRKTTQVEESVE
ncbi:MAG: DUF4129 domain-containing protein [Chloroflexia bacterium]|nr:DUF4129 domain-containing protein [Chloroflexia bacterium]